MISYGNAIEVKISERFNDSKCDLIGILSPQVICEYDGKLYFYTVEGLEFTKHANKSFTEKTFLEQINTSGWNMLRELEGKINSSKVIFVENDGNSRLVSTDKIQEVQLVFQ